MTMKKVKWGILGPGTIAQQFASDFQFASHGELVAVASRNKERSEAFAKEYGIPKSYDSYESLFNDSDLDAIYIATPHNFHLGQASAALRAGKSVLCEKPLTVSPAECQQLQQIAADNEQYLMEAMWTYFLPPILKAQDWIREGRIGAIKHIKSDFGYPVPFDPNGRMYNPDLAGGALLDMGVYNVAMAWLFNPELPKNINVLAKKAPTNVDDDVTMSFEYEDVLATLHASFRCKLPNITYVIGDEGYIKIPEFWRTSECFLYKVDECIEHFKDPRQGGGFEFEITSASKDILEGKKESSVIPLRTSLTFQELMAEVRSKC